MLPFLALSFASCEDEEAFDSDVGPRNQKEKWVLKRVKSAWVRKSTVL